MSIESLKEQARRHEQKEEWDKALKQYEKAIDELARDEQPDIGLYNRVGDLYVRVGNLASAVDSYEQAVDLYREAFLPNNAIAVCKKIIRNVPSRHQAYLKMGQIRAEQGFLPDARTHFLTYAERMQQDGELDESFRALIEFCDLAPDDVEVRIAVADQMVANERAEDAREQLAVAYRQVLMTGDADLTGQLADKIRAVDPEANLDEIASEDAGLVATAVSGDGEIMAAFGEIEGGGHDAADDDFGFGDPAEADGEPAEAALPESLETEEIEAGGLSLEVDDSEEDDEVELPIMASSADEEDDEVELPLMDTSSDEEDEEVALPVMDVSSEEEDEEEVPLPIMGTSDEDEVDLALEEGELETFAMDEEVEQEVAPLPGFDDDVPGTTDTEQPVLAPEAFGESERGAGPEYVSEPEEMPEIDVAVSEIAPASPEALEEAAEEARGEAAVVDAVEAAPVPEPQAPVAEPPTPEPPPAPEPEYVDLGAMILGDDEPEEKTTRFTVAYEEPSGDEQADFAKMLSQFKEKVAENLDTGDVKARHDLGTAYKEMGLLDEAISEFQAALRASADHLPTYEMLGQTFVEMGQPEAAVKSLSRAIEINDGVEDDLIGIYYYLARAHQALGEKESAVEFYDRVFSLDINFADVTERLRDLR